MSRPCFTQPAAPPAAALSNAWRARRLVATALIAALCSTALAPPVHAQINLPALGDTASEDFNLGAERHLGDAIMRDIRRDPDYLDDAILLEYLQSIWQPLLASARRQGDIGDDLNQRFPYEPFLVRDSSVNAFALPGGFVGVHLGLMAITQTRDELASVLAHEMTHINQRHIARGFANSKKQSLLSAAAMILGVLVATRSGSGDAASALITGGQAVGIQGQLNFSRDMEREADRIGSSIMAGAGFQPSGMASMFERLQQSSRLNDSGGYPYLRSHPLTTERIGEARSRLGVAGVGSPAARTSASPSALEHTAALARARVLMDPRVDALRRWQALDNNLGAASAAGGNAAIGAAAAAASAAAAGVSGGAAAGVSADAGGSTAARANNGADNRAGVAPSAAASGGAVATTSAATSTATTTTTTRQRFADAYSSALASTLLRDWARCDAALQKAAELAGADALAGAPDLRAERAVRLLKADSMLRRGDAAQAQSALAPLLKSGGPLLLDAATMSRPVMLLAAQIALAPSATGWPTSAATVDPLRRDALLRLQSDPLQTWVTRYPLDSEAWAMLARVSAQLGQRLRALRAEAESRYALGDLPGAIDRLRAGQRLSRNAVGGATGNAAGNATGNATGNGAAGDFVEASVIDSRLRTIEAERKQLLAEKLAV